MNIFSIQCS